MKANVLIVEDDNEINNLLKKILKDYRVCQAYSGTEAALCLKNDTFDLILLDLMLPGMSGEKFLDKLRCELGYKIPVLVISAKSTLEDKVSMLKIGADDYITKPFEPEEIAARADALIRRSNFNDKDTEVLVYKNLKVYPDLRKVTVLEKELYLTAREYEILYLLIKSPEKVYSRETLYELVWADGYYGTDHTVNVHVSNLRKKLKEYDRSEEYIQSVYGIGFRLKKS